MRVKICSIKINWEVYVHILPVFFRDNKIVQIKKKNIVQMNKIIVQIYVDKKSFK